MAEGEVVFITWSESSTGVLIELDEIGKLVRSQGRILVADAVSGLAVSPMAMDAWSVDAVVVGSQKGLMLPPGLGVVAIGPRAWEKQRDIQDTAILLGLDEVQSSGSLHARTVSPLPVGCRPWTTFTPRARRESLPGAPRLRIVFADWFASSGMEIYARQAGQRHYRRYSSARVSISKV